ncbi:fimbrial protein [Mixta intestinalis]|uniref:Uncharacterized protein n=1 Tax=Mixta intestinalis TaxID=1615494 RepID=A0A6P1Q509_9GAMM|nr:fimbrial protein [Mixta intestinalis]QHM73157.1 hypothetical protein C7M51_03502 [Mixta intestinalis]
MIPIIKKTGVKAGSLLLLFTAPFIYNNSYASTVECENISNSVIAVNVFDFNNLPTQLPKSVPVGTTIYEATVNVDARCAKKLSGIASGPQKIYASRNAIKNPLGSKSGLTFYVTINGERGTERKSYDTGLTTEAFIVTGLNNKDDYTKVNIPVHVELVKTGENVSISPLSNDVWLFSLGDSGTGNLRFRATNVKKLSFTDYTCNVTSPNIQQTLPLINMVNLKNVGPVTGYSTDFNVSLNCNGNLWSTLAVKMAFSGQTVTGLEQQGVYQFLDQSGAIAEGIGFQIFHKNSSGNYVSSAKNEWFEIGNFANNIIGQSDTITVPLRASYYRTSGNLNPGMYSGTITYTVDYK